MVLHSPVEVRGIFANRDLKRQGSNHTESGLHLGAGAPRSLRMLGLCTPADQLVFGVKSSAATTREKGSLAASFTCFTKSAFEASNRHMQCASPGTKVVRM